MIATVTVAAGVLLTSVALKAWSGLTLMHRYPGNVPISDAQSRRLFLIGKIAPLAACAAIVVLAACTRLWWIIAPACAFFMLILYGVVTRVQRTYRAQR